MADNIGSTGLSFNTANMKPSADEQIDTLWGRNIADNTALNAYSRIPINSQGDQQGTFTGIFRRPSTHNFLRTEASWGETSGITYGTTLTKGTMYLFIKDETGADAGTLISYNPWTADDRVYTHDFDISSLSADSPHTFKSNVVFTGAEGNPFRQNFYFVSGSAFTY